MHQEETDPLGVGPCEDLDDFARKVTEPLTLAKVAREALDCFETRERDGDGPYVATRDDRPQWVHDLVFAAHNDGEFLPDDWRYARVREALDTLAEQAEHLSEEGIDAIGYEFADGAVDVYNTQRIAWLASHGDRAEIADQASAEHGAPGSGIIERIGYGQAAEAREIFDSVVTSLRNRLGA